MKFVSISLTIPVMSATAERTFSAMHRLKSFLRSTMTQTFFNDAIYTRKKQTYTRYIPNEFFKCK